ncbi:MAG: Pneumovirus attachment glycoprotein G [Phormidesmis priestleyi Ana]|uniref:Pneumovirus attachment glycoprotein G n=1 Tax=Phormidesmis priestleyi Ana TaxID=1666911 RepID=A0A0P8BTS1_9CYAN|nr:MAG: Pneumovirus attachment glycoprotein G [Phormidesmis priestleyi Ana]
MQLSSLFTAHLRLSLFSRFVKAAVITTSLACAASINIQAANAQSARQTTAPSSTVTGDFNNVIQVPNQNNAQSSNTNNPVFNNISPLQTPANSEDDLSFNVSVGFSHDVTVSVGLLYQPGRTRSHQVRMQHLAEQTDLLKTQKEIAEAELQLLQMQIQAAEQQLQVSRTAAASVEVSNDAINY